VPTKSLEESVWKEKGKRLASSARKRAHYRDRERGKGRGKKDCEKPSCLIYNKKKEGERERKKKRGGERETRSRVHNSLRANSRVRKEKREKA